MLRPVAATELGPRLQAVAEQVLPGEPVADLCCDHAALATALVEAGRVPRAVAIDVAAGPLAGAAARLRGLPESVAARIELRQGDGAEALALGEVATVVIAGVGAPLAATLVDAGQCAGTLATVRRLVIQANDGWPRLGALREALAERGWGLVDEVLARERGRIYVVLVAERGEVGSLDADARDFGPILRRGEDPLWGAWLQTQRRRAKAALAGLARAQEGARAQAERGRWDRWAARLDEQLARL